MKTVLSAKIINPFNSRTPKGFYKPPVYHTGIDLDYNFEDIASPCDLTIILNNEQGQMGNTIYSKDDNGYIHVFAHQKEFIHKVGDKVLKDTVLGHSGNSGSRTTGAHLHYEILAPSGVNLVMKRNGLPYQGDNVDPIEYLLHLSKGIVSDFAISAVEKAKKRGITDWERPQSQVGDAVLESMLIKVGLLTSTMGSVTKERFAVVLDRLNKL